MKPDDFHYYHTHDPKMFNSLAAALDCGAECGDIQLVHHAYDALQAQGRSTLQFKPLELSIKLLP